MHIIKQHGCGRRSGCQLEHRSLRSSRSRTPPLFLIGRSLFFVLIRFQSFPSLFDEYINPTSMELPFVKLFDTPPRHRVIYKTSDNTAYVCTYICACINISVINCSGIKRLFNEPKDSSKRICKNNY